MPYYNNMKQIRIHGRGGQGVVTTAELIALAAFYDGRQVQAFPSLGVERGGAPIQSFVRISTRKIITCEQVYQADVIIIQDSTLLNTVNVFQGINNKTKIIINAQPKQGLDINLKNKEIYFVAATEMALKIFGQNIVNTIMLGVFAKKTKLVSLNSLLKAIKVKFADKGEEIVKKNIQALKLAYEK